MLVLVAHGSRNETWRDSLQQIANTLKDRDPRLEVRLAFMQFSGPTLAHVVERARDQGTREFWILPLFMATAGHVDKDIRPMVEALDEKHRDSRFHLLTPVGEHPLFHDIILQIAHNALNQGQSGS